MLKWEKNSLKTLLYQPQQVLGGGGGEGRLGNSLQSRRAQRCGSCGTPGEAHPGYLSGSKNLLTNSQSATHSH